MNRGFSIYWILLSLTCLFAMSYPLGAFLFGFGVHADWWTVLLGVLLAAEVGIGLWAARRMHSIELMAMLAFLMCQYFFLRIFGYITFSRASLRNLYLLFPSSWNEGMINRGLNWVVIATGAMVLGLLLASWLYRKWGHLPPRLAVPSERIVVKIPSLKSMALTALIVYAVDTYFTLFLGQSASKNCVDEAIKGKWLIHFFSGDMVIFVTLVTLASQFDRLRRAQWVYLLVSISIYFAYTLALGSRGGVLRVGTILFALWLASAPYAKIKAKTFVLALPALAVLSAVFFMLGTVSRHIGSTACSGERVGVAEAFDDLGGNDLPSRFADVPGSELERRNRAALRLPPVLAKISDRLGLLDYPVGIVAVPGSKDAMNKYVNLKYMAKNLANNLVIGVPFDDAKFMTSSLMPIIYRGYDYKHVEENFLSDMWTLWGSAFALTGPIWGLVLIFLLCFAFQYLFLWGTDRLDGLVLYFRTAALWLGCAAIVFFQMSFDHAAFVTIIFSFQIAVVLVLTYAFDWLFRKAAQ